MTPPITVGRLQVAAPLHAFVAREALPGTGLTESAFWAGVESILAEFGPRNAALLQRRDQLQARIDAWWREHKGQAFDVAAHTAFLRDIGYLTAEPAAFKISTANVDPEIACIAGPQLVVPVSNARYALNAGNARWGSLYDALYGTDAIAETGATARGAGYNPARGAQVVAKAKAFLDAQVAGQEQLVKAEQRRYDLAEARYRVGTDSYLTVLSAQQELYAAQQNMLSLRYARLANLIGLYQALGGGWQ